MPQRKVVRKKSPVRQALPRLQSNLKKLRHDAETLLSRARKQAAQVISRDQKDAMQRLVKQGQQLRAELDKRVQRASKDVEERSRRFFATLEKEGEKRLEALVHRLIGPSRQEVQSLSRRVQHLEQLVKGHTHGSTPAALGATPLLQGELPMGVPNDQR